jgi:hypothetical protein
VGTVWRCGFWSGAAHRSIVVTIAPLRMINRVADRMIFLIDLIEAS